MRKFTLYQAAKYTGISRYKLEKSISEGALRSENGLGNAKCFILKDELDRFLDSHGDRLRSKPTNGVVQPDPPSEVVSRSVHEALLKEKAELIHRLEEQTTKFLPLVKARAQEVEDISEKIAHIEQVRGLTLKAIDLVSSFKKKEKEDLLNKFVNT